MAVQRSKRLSLRLAASPSRSIIAASLLLLTCLVDVALGRNAIGADMTRAFAAEFVQDYARKPSDAIVSRFDHSELIRRIYRIKFDALWPQVERTLRGYLAIFDRYGTITHYRPVLDRDERQVQVEVINDEGQPLMFTLSLVQSDGAIRIADVQTAGQPLCFSSIIRHQDFLKGRAGSAPGDGEWTLRELGKAHGAAIREAMHDFSTKRYTAAYQIWRTLPDAVKAQPFWRYMRVELAFTGCKAAVAELDADIQSGMDTVDPLVAYHWLRRTNRPAALLALDQALKAHQEPVIYRCEKAALLLEMQRRQEAYDLYCDIVALSPFSVLAYIGGVRAAAAMNQPEAAMALLRKWSLVAPPSGIDGVLEQLTESEIAVLRQSGPYQAWLNLARSPSGH